jgi:DNA polymerase-3 subunit gamma/tau
LPGQALYLRWRPRTFEHVIGQEHIIRTLRNAIIQDRVRHAYLFNGPRGTGKTTMARILAKAVNCLHDDPAQRPCDECRFCEAINEGRFLDLIEIDAASHNGVDDVRDLREKIAFSPSEGRYKVYIIDEVHRFSGAAFDALLKTLEEPPGHAIFVLATTELDKVPATIKSRALMFEFRRVSAREVADRLEMIANYEGVEADREALDLVARQGTGSVRDSISLLDQLISDPGQRITLEMAEQVLGTASHHAIVKLIQSILDNDVAAGLDLLNRAIDEGADPGQLGRQIVDYLRNLMLAQTAGPALVDASNELRATLQQQTAAISRPALLRAIRAFNAALGEVRTGWQPQLPLELALVESTRPLHEEAPVVLPEIPVAAPRPKGSKIPAKAAPPAEKAPADPDPELDPAQVPTISLGDVQRAWPTIHDAARKHSKPLAALLDHASAKAVEGRTLILAVNESVFKEKLEAEEKRKELAQIIKAILRAPMHVKVIVATSAAPTHGGGDTIPGDDLLSYVTGDLGGTVTDIEDSQEGSDS